MLETTFIRDFIIERENEKGQVSKLENSASK